MTKKRKSSLKTRLNTMMRKSKPDDVIKNAITVVSAFKVLMQAAGTSLASILLVVALVNIVAVTSVAKCKYDELPLGEGEGDREWWLLGGATGVSMASIWISISMQVNPPRYRTTGKIALGVVVAALLAVIVVGDLDPDSLLQLMNAMV